MVGELNYTGRTGGSGRRGCRDLLGESGLTHRHGEERLRKGSSATRPPHGVTALYVQWVSVFVSASRVRQDPWRDSARTARPTAHATATRSSPRRLLDVGRVRRGLAHAHPRSLTAGLRALVVRNVRAAQAHTNTAGEGSQRPRTTGDGMGEPGDDDFRVDRRCFESLWLSTAATWPPRRRRCGGCWRRCCSRSSDADCSSCSSCGGFGTRSSLGVR